MTQPERKRTFFVALAIVMVCLVVWVFARALVEPKGLPDPLDRSYQQPGLIAQEQKPWAATNQSSRMVTGPGSQAAQRNLFESYARRAYPGAPPFIPHPTEESLSTGESCLSCHQQGGYVARFQAYAPVTPHPEFVSCRQCHVEQQDVALIVPSLAATFEPPRRGEPAIPGGPPPIPHPLQLRENCAACHTGPAAPYQIRSSHPDRVYCRQCHVAQVEDTPVFARAIPGE
ncbi:MAG: cytochrome C [Acidobacteria bacterium]|nr:cytochrome C [Acidobacteriota bacterium]MCB9397838.1 cytochrome C [Acidobacteriota bacterium]